jgi:hypothetical protein
LLYFTHFLRLFLFFITLSIFSQILVGQVIISGKVTDSQTGDAIPFANVFIKNSTIGTVTDFEGQYKINIDNAKSDTLVVSYIGYSMKYKLIEKHKSQTINFQLIPQTINLTDVVITDGKWENPAWEILRNVIDNKKRNNLSNLEAYQYENYSRIEMALDNITDKFRERKAMKKILSIIDSAASIAGDEGKPVIPIYISETISDVYHLRKPEHKKENIKKVKITGLVKDTDYMTDLMQGAFEDFNFYENFVRVLNKDFISPISDSWNIFYEYELLNYQPVLYDGIPCFKIAFKPKQPQDLAFNGVMWIADSSNHFALKQIDVTIEKEANLNFIEKITIQQQMIEIVENKGWLPDKTRILVDIGEIRDDWAGMLLKFYSSNRNFVLNSPKELKFYEEDVTTDAEAYNFDDTYWEKNRHDPLSTSEVNLFAMIDTIKNVPVIRSYMEILDIALNGYQEIKKVDIGPYLFTYAYNNIEANRLRLGFRTNEHFSTKYILEGYGAYGSGDGKFKYNFGGSYIFSRKKWGLVSASHQYDIDQVGIFSDDAMSNQLFTAFVRFGDLKNPYLHRINQVSIESDVWGTLRLKAMLRHRQFEPLFDFEYLETKNNITERNSNFNVSEVLIEGRYAFGERYVNRGNRRYIITSSRFPVLTFRFTQAIKDIANSNFEFQKYVFGLEHDVRLWNIGRTFYKITAGIIPSTIPYPLLETHLGNQSIFLNSESFNLMNFTEFVSDRYASLKVTHRLEGLIFNRIPLIKKMNLRTVLGGNLIYGTVSQANLDIIPYTNDNSTSRPHFESFKANKPYIEISYGIENIFRFIRLDFVHRLTYLENEKASPFGIKLGVEVKL